MIADSLDAGRKFALPACLRMMSLAFCNREPLHQVLGVAKELGLKCRTPPSLPAAHL